VINNSYKYVTDTSATVNIIDITTSPVITLVAGTNLTVNVKNSNTGAVTLSYNGTTAVS
jgi:hypothetical protein